MHVTPSALEHALLEVDFPADKDTLLESARRREAAEEVLLALRSLPPGVTYDNRDEVVRSVRRPEVGSGPSTVGEQAPHRPAGQGRLAERPH